MRYVESWRWDAAEPTLCPLPTQRVHDRRSRRLSSTRDHFSNLSAQQLDAGAGRSRGKADISLCNNCRYRHRVGSYRFEVFVAAHAVIRTTDARLRLLRCRADGPVQEGDKSANIHVRSGAIWGMPVTKVLQHRVQGLPASSLERSALARCQPYQPGTW